MNIELFEELVIQINLYSMRNWKYKPVNTTVYDIIKLTGRNILMDMSKFPKVKLEWSQDNPAISWYNVKNRFFKLRDYLYFTGNYFNFIYYLQDYFNFIL